MDNNKARLKDKEKSNPELRKMKPKKMQMPELKTVIKLACMTASMKKPDSFSIKNLKGRNK